MEFFYTEYNLKTIQIEGECFCYIYIQQLNFKISKICVIRVTVLI